MLCAGLKSTGDENTGIRPSMTKSASFSQNVIKLISGASIAQLIPLLAYPLLTRLFSPEAFGNFATIMLFSSLMTVVSSGCYEHAILMTRSSRESADLVCHILLRAVGYNLCFLILLIYFGDFFADWLNNPTLQTSLFFAPLIAFLGVVLACCAEWLVKYQRFWSLSVNRVTQSLSVAFAKIVLGISFKSGQGLALGEVIGRFVAAVFVSIQIVVKNRDDFCGVSKQGMDWARGRFASFPRIMIPDQLLNILSGSIHIVFIGPAFGAEQLGFVALLYSACYFPITVISTSIKDVFRQQAHIYYLETGSCRELFLVWLKRVSLFSCPFFILGFFLAPDFFTLLLGEQWQPVGQYAQIMLPMYYINLVSMSFSGILIFTENVRVSLIWQIVSLILTILALFVGCYIIEDIIFCLYLVAAVRSLTYFAYLFLAYYYSSRQDFGSSRGRFFDNY